MRKVCFLTTGDLAGHILDDDLAIEPLKDLGWDVTKVSWREQAGNWDDFEAVIIRSTWDYHRSPDAFLDVLRNIHASNTRLENSLATVEWNINKKYLADLESKGIKIVPTVFSSEDIGEKLFSDWQRHFDCDELVIKPAVSANSDDTYRRRLFDAELTAIFRGREYMVQPFVPQIVAEGEYSLFYFGGEYSHTILKTPQPDDFRVQQEHGGFIRAAAPAKNLLDAGEKILAEIAPVPLYVRVDLVKNADGDFALMELELIEPSLYFRTDTDAAGRFAARFNQRMNEL